MSITIVATPGGESANSYATEVEVEASASELFPVPLAWIDRDPEDGRRAMIHATRLLDSLGWRGEPETCTQALAFPRVDGLGCRVGNAEVPSALKRAQGHLTCWLLEQQCAGVGDPFGPQDNDGLAAISFGGELSMTFAAGATTEAPGVTYMRRTIRPMLRGLVLASQPRVA